MLYTLFTYLMAVAGLGLLIFVHEFGHFIAAKIFGIKVKEANLGFGPKIVAKQWGETEYGISVLPLGGYVKLAGMEPEEPAEDEDKDRTFDSKTIFMRIVLILAGPIMNLLVAIPLLASIYFIGFPVITNKVEKVVPNSMAQKAGIMAGDSIVKINEKKITSWTEFTEEIAPSAGKTIIVTVDRDGKKLTFNSIVGTRRMEVLINGKKEKRVQGFLGVQGSLETKRDTVLVSLRKGAAKTLEYTTLMVTLFAKLFTGGMSFSTVAKGSAGPVGIIYLSSKLVRRGIMDFIALLGLISPNLAIINLLPFAPLDGGRIAFLIYEGIFGKPVSKERIMQFQAVGITILIFLMALVIVSDANKILTNTFPMEGL